MGAIDVWAQITTPEMAARPWMETLLRWTNRAAGALPSVAGLYVAASVTLTVLFLFCGLWLVRSIAA